MKTVSIVLLSLTAVSSGATWYKGNTHTHSSNSDGSSSPSAVIQWYVSNGYNFLAVTDHNWFSPQEAFGLATTYNTPSFLLLTGEEVTDFASDPDPNKRGAIHILGLNINQRVFTAPPGTPAAEVVRTDTAAIRAAGGIPIYAHPNFTCCPTPGDMIANGVRFMEVMNPAVSDSNDWLWDQLLSAGTLVYGTASDDEHSLTPGEWGPPGQAWIHVRAESLSTANLLAAMQNGDFYASEGVQLADIVITPTSYSVSVKPVSLHAYNITFIGDGGQQLLSVSATSATYTFLGTEHYVRAVVRDTYSYPYLRAWTQPKFVTPVTVSLSPANTTMNAGSSKRFNFQISGSTNRAVTWAVTPNIGTISQAGEYTAPSLPSQQTVTVQAISVANPTAIGISTVTIKAAH